MRTVRVRISAMCVVAIVGVMAVALGAGATAAGASTPAKTAPTKAEFITKADAICSAGNKVENAFQAQVLGGSSNPSKAQLKELGKGIAKIILREQAKISKLTPPSADKATIKKLLVELKKEAKALQADPSLLSTGKGLDKAAKQAQAYGFKVCGNPAA